MTETTTMAKETIKLALESCIMTFYRELKNSEPNQGFEEKLDTQKRIWEGEEEEEEGTTQLSIQLEERRNINYVLCVTISLPQLSAGGWWPGTGLHLHTHIHTNQIQTGDISLTGEVAEDETQQLMHGCCRGWTAWTVVTTVGHHMPCWLLSLFVCSHKVRDLVALTYLLDIDCKHSLRSG